MPRIELYYDPDCPNVPEARRRLRRALERLGLEPGFVELVSDRADLPAYVVGYGSPTFFVDGQDVMGAKPAGASCCRVYRSEEELGGNPSVEQLVAGIRVSMT